MFKMFIVFILIIYTIDNHSLTKLDYNNVEKENFTQLIKTIKKININKESSILTFDTKVQTSLILNNYKNFLNITGIYLPINDEMLENRIINVFKFLNLNKTDFNDFIKNKKHGWRFINNNIAETFYIKYQANRLTTYKNSMDFSPDELIYISKSSPLHTQQLILPTFEIKRLIDKFSNFQEKKKFKPELIIINSSDVFTKNLILDNNLYCTKIINEIYTIYFYKKTHPNC